MVNTNALRGKIAEKKLSQVQIAKYLGITPNTFYRKMGNQKFDTDEIFKLMEVLELSKEQAVDIFFCQRCHLVSNKRKRGM